MSLSPSEFVGLDSSGAEGRRRAPFPCPRGGGVFCLGSGVGGKAGPPVVLRMATWWQP